MTSPAWVRYGADYHVPIMVDEVLRWLHPSPAGRYLDGTLGGAGHSLAILDACAPDGHLIALDRDAQAIEHAQQRLAHIDPSRLTILHGNYGDAHSLLTAHHLLPVDGWLIDAGVSSHQLDEPSRGFSFQQDGPLDMRMGQDVASLADWLQHISHAELSRVLRVYGEHPQPTRIASAILNARDSNRLRSTSDLREVIVEATPAALKRGSHIHPATLAFQALRIAVNAELEHLERAVADIPRVVKPGGYALFISFHSLEDRIVKQGLRSLANPCTCPPNLPVCACKKTPLVHIHTTKPITASPEEVAHNPRARSAKLRVAQVLRSLD
jgi:16S rRNA (cytosine1402-N4)-methyltransferase